MVEPDDYNCHEITSDPEKYKVLRRVEIGFDPLYRDRLEEVASVVPTSQEFFREALAGITLNGSLEHVPRLVHDQITIGRDVYTAQSWRYVTMHIQEGELGRIHIPKAIQEKGLTNEFIELSRTSIAAYNRLAKMGIPEEDARFAYLWAFDSNVVFALQGPKLVDFTLQNLNSPYESVREVAREVLKAFGQEFPKTAQRLRIMSAGDGLKSGEREMLDTVRKSLWTKPWEEMSVSWLVRNPCRVDAVAAYSCKQENPPSVFAEKFSEETQKKVLAATLNSGHTSIAEHAHFFVRFAMSEAGIQQLRRHRIPVQRARDMWIAAQDEYQIVVPPTIKRNPEAEVLYRQVWEGSVKFRHLGVEKGVPLPELDNAVIVGVRVPAFLVTNATDIIHIGSRRLCNTAQWEIREWMYRLAECLVRTSPDLFVKLGPECFKGKCPEQKPCGHPEDYRNWHQKIWPKPVEGDRANG